MGQHKNLSGVLGAIFDKGFDGHTGLHAVLDVLFTNSKKLSSGVMVHDCSDHDILNFKILK